MPKVLDNEALYAEHPRTHAQYVYLYFVFISFVYPFALQLIETPCSIEVNY